MASRPVPPVQLARRRRPAPTPLSEVLGQLAYTYRCEASALVEATERQAARLRDQAELLDAVARAIATGEATPPAPPAAAYSVAAAARRLQVSDDTVRRWVRTGRLRALQIDGLIRIDAAELERALQGAQD